jgi:hypothetical protein
MRCSGSSTEPAGRDSSSSRPRDDEDRVEGSAYEVRIALAALIDALSVLPTLDPKSAEYADTLEVALRQARQLGPAVDRLLAAAATFPPRSHVT